MPTPLPMHLSASMPRHNVPGSICKSLTSSRTGRDWSSPHGTCCLMHRNPGPPPRRCQCWSLGRNSWGLRWHQGRPSKCSHCPRNNGSLSHQSKLSEGHRHWDNAASSSQGQTTEAPAHPQIQNQHPSSSRKHIRRSCPHPRWCWMGNLHTIRVCRELALHSARWSFGPERRICRARCSCSDMPLQRKGVERACVGVGVSWAMAATCIHHGDWTPIASNPRSNRTGSAHSKRHSKPDSPKLTPLASIAFKPGKAPARPGLAVT